VQHKSEFEQWAWSFFNANCQFLAISFGIVAPERMTELFATLFSMLLGATLNAVLIASLTSIMADGDASERAYRAKLDEVNQYMTATRIPHSIRTKIRSYLELRFPQRRSFDESGILGEISRPLREEVCKHLCRRILASLYVIETGEPGLAGAISQALDRQVYVAFDCIIRQGEQNDSMYFIDKGFVDVLSTQTSEPVTTLGPLSFFGEVALVSKTKRAVATVRVTYSDRP